MTNDLSTLSGALLEMKDQLIYELGQKGVTASYDSSTGLLGLIGEISNIQTGGGSCYHIEFDQASYSTTGSVTVSVTVLKNYSACVGETVTFTSSTSTTTTATTDSNGVATATISFSGSTTLTASIGGVSDTATVTVQQYLFYDDCSVDNTSNWSSSNAYAYWESGPGTAHTLTFDTDHYVFSHSVGSFLGLQLPNLSTSLDNYVLTADILANGTNTDYGGGLGILQETEKGMGMVQPNSTNGKHTYLYNPTSGRGSVISQTTTSNYVVGDYHTHRLTKQGTTVKYEILHNGTVIFTNTKTSIATNLATQTIPCICVGRWDTAKFKNIKVEAL